MPGPVTGLRALSVRWLVFNLVGATGILVQLGVLACLLTLGVDYLLATALAVEAAVLNNFFWHERWTWRDRRGGKTGSVSRLVRFNLTVGVVSIAGNLALMGFLVGRLAVPPLGGNVIVIASIGVANFLLSDSFVFRTDSR
jgi:dolichol-phosphate mannosyltransferase